jgi:molybdopterin molybdotransferase
MNKENTLNIRYYVSINEALDLINNSIDFSLDVINIDIEKCNGYTLAEDIYSNFPNPMFNNSAMDGIAINYDSLIKNFNKTNGVFKVITFIKAGKYLSKVNKGLLSKKLNKIIDNDVCIEISTGAPIPPNFDTVIPYEDLEVFYDKEKKLVKLKIDINKIKKYQNVRFEGEDFKKGDLVLSKGTLLTSFNINILAFNNIRKVKVYRKPIISLLTTGNEIVELNKKLNFGEIFNSNKYSLINFINNFSILGKVKHLKDKKESILNEFYKLLKISDIIVTVGGVSAGKFDFINEVLEDIKAEIIFNKIKIKPGKPTTFAIYEKANKKVLIFSLPGNPLSSLFNFYHFVLPAIFKLQNYNYKPLVLKGILKRDFNLKIKDERAIMYPSIYNFDNKINEFVVDFIDKWGSHTIGIFNKVNSYILLNQSENLKEGEIINFYPLDLLFL